MIEGQVSPEMRDFLNSVNFKIAVALKRGVPVLHLIAALEKMAADMEQKIEDTMSKDKK